VPEMFRDEVTHISPHKAVVPHRPAVRSCIPHGLSSPACSAIVKQFFTGKGPRRPDTKSRTQRRGSGRANRASIVFI
jgi:hypothetical protein